MVDRKRRFGSLTAIFAIVSAVSAAGVGASAQQSTTYTYDALGRVTSVLRTGGSATGGLMTYTYDSAGNRTALNTSHVPIANAVNVYAAPNSSNDTIALNITGDIATSVAVTTQASHGAATANGASITYTPTGGFVGVDTFQYTASNGAGTSAPATATVTVGAFTATIQVTGSGPVNLRSLANTAGYNGAQNVTLNFVVANGVTIKGAGGGGSGVDTGAWPTGYTNTLTLTVQTGGAVYGGGGAGGIGGGGLGASGGDAVYAQAPIAIVVNSGGVIKAGGGGGGGGHTGFDNQLQISDGGGGGGGGAPNGPGGAGASADRPGGAGSAGTVSGGGAGGTGASSIAGGGSPGGNGGALGASGSSSSGAGGAAGYAIRKNGNAVTVTNSGTITGTVG